MKSVCKCTNRDQDMRVVGNHVFDIDYGMDTFGTWLGYGLGHVLRLEYGLGFMTHMHSRTTTRTVYKIRVRYGFVL